MSKSDFDLFHKGSVGWLDWGDAGYIQIYGDDFGKVLTVFCQWLEFVTLA